MSTPINVLDDTALEALLDTMDIESIIALCGTSTHYKRICDDENGRLWYLLMVRDFSDYLTSGTYDSYKAGYMDLTRRKRDTLAIMREQASDFGFTINLPDSILYGVDFGVSMVRQFNYNGANYSGADLSHAIIRSSSAVGLDMMGSNFNNAKLNYTRFENIRLDGSIFTNAELVGATFIGCEIDNVIFIDANLENAEFINNNNSDDPHDNVNFTNSNLTNVHFMSIHFNRCIMSNAFLLGIISGNAGLGYSAFTECKFSYSILSGVRFDGIVLSRFIFDNAICIATSFVNADIEGCRFRKTNLTDADFTNAMTEETVFIDSILDNTKGI